MNDSDIQYTDVNEDGSDVQGVKITLDARKPKDKYEEEFIKHFPGMKYFPSKAFHKQFKDFRDKMISGTDKSILYRGWFKNVMKWVGGKNMGRIVIGVGAALSRLENEPAFLEWTTKKEAKDWLAQQKSFGKAVTITNAKPIGRQLGEEE